MGRDRNILITGAGGQVGRSLRRQLPQARFADHKALDVTDRAGVRSSLEGVETVVHLAALTNVDGCEVQPNRAYEVNARGTEVVAEETSRVSGRVIYLSTDYVFSGEKKGCYAEDDGTGPLNVYGASKLAGETTVLRSEENTVVRTSWVFGEGKNFIRSIVSAAKAAPEVTVVDDQYGRPTSAVGLAAAINAIVEKNVRGLVHVTGAGDPCSWADLAEHALATLGIQSSIHRVSTAEYARAAGKAIASRPRNSVLCLERAERLNLPLDSWSDAVDQYVGKLP